MGKKLSLAGLLLLACLHPSWAQWDLRDGWDVSGVRVSSIDGSLDGARNVNIRGLNSLRGNNNPLIVVDGCIVGTSAMDNLEAFFQYGENSYTNPLNLMAYLNVNDIEKVEILKNVSATALYGAKGADGVILITTRRGGKDDQPLQVDWHSRVGASFADAAGTRPGVSHDHWLGVSGQTDRTGYSVSAYFRQVNQVLPQQPTTRGGIRTNFETRTNKILWFGFNSALSVGDINTPLTGAWYGQPSATLSLRNIPGTPALQNWLEDYDDNAKDYHTTNALYLAVNPLPGLQWRTTVGLDFDNATRYIWYGKQTPFGAASNGAASIITSKTLNYNAETKLDFQHYIGGKHFLKATAAAVLEGNWDKFSTMNGTDFWTHALRAQGLSLAGSKAVIRDFNYGLLQWGAYGKLGYSWAGYAGVDLLARISSTPRYDDGTPALYPSAEAWWNIKESLLRGVDAVQEMKLRGGWGMSGKNAFVPYQLLDRYTTGAYPEAAFDVAHYYEALNKRESREWSVSLEASFLQGRLTAEAGYYVKETTDNIDLYTFGGPGRDGIVWVEKPRETVYTQQAALGNAGVEWALEGRPLETRDWHWRVTTWGCYNTNRILDVDVPDRLGRQVGAGVLANVNVLGYSVGSLYGYALDENGNYKDQTGDGRITAVDRAIIGNTQPRVFGGLGTALSYKAYTLEAQFQGAAGHQLLNMNRMLEDAESTVSARYVEKADYLRLERLSLCWDLPLRVKWVKAAKVSLDAYNLFTLTEYSGGNPDVNSFGISNLSTGFDYGSCPLARTVMAGIQVNF